MCTDCRRRVWKYSHRLGKFCTDSFVEYYITNIQNNPKRRSGDRRVTVRLTNKIPPRQPKRPQNMDIGIVERETNRLKLFPVDKRDPETLTAINKDNVVPGTTVVRRLGCV